MQEQQKVQAAEPIQETLEEMVDHCVRLLSSHVRVLSVACYQMGNFELGNQLWADYCRWGHETLVPALRRIGLS